MKTPVWKRASAGRWESTKGYCVWDGSVWTGYAYGACGGHFSAGSSLTLESVKAAVHRLWVAKGVL